MPLLSLRRSLALAVIAAVSLSLGHGDAQDKQPAAGPAPADKDYESLVKPLLAKHCLVCHGAQKPKGDLRLDQLASDFGRDADRRRWQEVLKRVKAGEMPPEGKPRPSDDEIKLLAGWIETRVKLAEAKRAAEGRVVLRRLNRTEYENTVRDLLGLDVALKELLPLDSSANGFDNVADALHTSSFLMEKYLEAADHALNIAITNGPQPQLIKKRYSLKDQHS